jgi:hypothetical protein
MSKSFAPLAPRTVHEPQGDMGFVCGLGINSYLLGIKAIARKIEAGAVL